MGRGYSRQDILDTVRRIRESPRGDAPHHLDGGLSRRNRGALAGVDRLIGRLASTTWGSFSTPRRRGHRPRPADPGAPAEARRRASIVKAVQAESSRPGSSRVGTVAEVLVEGVSPESDFLLTGRMISQAPDIDGQVYITAGRGMVGEIN